MLRCDMLRPFKTTDTLDNNGVCHTMLNHHWPSLSRLDSSSPQILQHLLVFALHDDGDELRPLSRPEQHPTNMLLKRRMCQVGHVSGHCRSHGHRYAHKRWCDIEPCNGNMGTFIGTCQPVLLQQPSPLRRRHVGECAGELSHHPMDPPMTCD